MTLVVVKEREQYTQSVNRYAVPSTLPVEPPEIPAKSGYITPTEPPMFKLSPFNGENWYRSAVSSSKIVNQSVIEVSLREMKKLDVDERPVNEAFKYANQLEKILKQTVRIDNIQVWPTNNCTIEFGLRIDKDNQFVLETGKSGITGFITINGADQPVQAKGNVGDLIDQLQSFASLLH